MIATIALIAEKKKFQRSQRQQSLRHKKFYLSDCCRCDRWRVVSI